MVNKKGWIRIVEAGISILLIISVVLVIAINRTGRSTGHDLTPFAESFLDEIARDNELRIEILSYNVSQDENSSGNQAVLNKLNEYWNSQVKQINLKHEFKICDTISNCFLEEYPDSGSVYVSDRIVSTNIDNTDFSPRRIKIFVWEGS